jgi:hypothetical protein
MEYYDGYYDGLRQGQRNFIFPLFSKALRYFAVLIYLAFVFLPFLLASFLLTDALATTYGNDFFIKIILTGVVGYLLYGFIYFLKGTLIALKAKNLKSWFLLWLLCVLFSCGLQVLVVQGQLETFLSVREIGRPIPHSYFWSWLGGLMFSVIVYHHYKFHTNISPKAIFWAYNAGVKLGVSMGKTATSLAAENQRKYFTTPK